MDGSPKKWTDDAVWLISQEARAAGRASPAGSSSRLDSSTAKADGSRQARARTRTKTQRHNQIVASKRSGDSSVVARRKKTIRSVVLSLGARGTRALLQSQKQKMSASHVSACRAVFHPKLVFSFHFLDQNMRFFGGTELQSPLEEHPKPVCHTTRSLGGFQMAVQQVASCLQMSHASQGPPRPCGRVGVGRPLLPEGLLACRWPHSLANYASRLPSCTSMLAV